MWVVEWCVYWCGGVESLVYMAVHIAGLAELSPSLPWIGRKSVHSLNKETDWLKILATKVIFFFSSPEFVASASVELELYLDINDSSSVGTLSRLLLMWNDILESFLWLKIAIYSDVGMLRSGFTLKTIMLQTYIPFSHESVYIHIGLT